MMDGMTLSDICYIVGKLIIQIDKENPEEVLKAFIQGVTISAECSLALRNKKIQNLMKEVVEKE
jgi:exonuclease VII small subunit